MTYSDSIKYSDTTAGSKGSGSKFLYLLAGAGIGAATTLLFAPKAGVDLRSDLADITRKGYDETLDLAHQLKEQSADLYKTIKEKTDTVYSLAAQKFSSEPDFIDRTSNMAGDLLNVDTGQPSTTEPIRASGPGRRPTNVV